MNRLIHLYGILTNTVQKTYLGRWERTGDKLNSIKVYWANMDHCGTCGREFTSSKASIPPKNSNRNGFYDLK